METIAVAASAQVYRPRHPERTVLYRALAHHLERFLLVYEERFQGIDFAGPQFPFDGPDFSAHGAVRVEDRQGAVRLGRYMIAT